MAGRTLLGILTPSSNTRLEPMTQRLLTTLPEVSAHFSRFRVLDVSLSPTAVAQFDIETILAAAELLADARVDVIAWSGTSGGWIGLDADRELCRRITDRCGCPATTAALALFEALRLAEATTVGLVTPYPDDMQAAIVRCFALEGVTVTAAANHAVTRSNFELSEISPEVLTGMVKGVAEAGPGVIVTFCTNLAGTDLVAGWETNFAVPVYDSIAVTVWHALRLAGVDASRISSWGSLFALS
jgi:maleate isomerase